MKTSFVYFLFLSSLFSLFSCQEETKETITPEVSTTHDSTFINRFSTELISEGTLSGTGEEGLTDEKQYITNQADWDKLLKQMDAVNKISSYFLNDGKVDFSTHNVIAVFDSPKSTGGYSIRAEADTDGKIIYANTIKTSPDPDGFVTTALTQPYYIFKITKSDLPLKWEK